MMKKHSFSYFMVIVLISAGWLFCNQHEVHAIDQGMPITTQLEVPATNKVLASSSVVNVDLQPEATADFAVRLNNTSNRDLKVLVRGTIAHTDATGNINLVDPSHHNLDKSFKYDLQQLGLKPQKVTVKAHSTTRVPLTVEAPNNYQGTISGAILVKLLQKHHRHNQVNTFQIAYGVLLNIGDYNQLKPKVDLGKVAFQSKSGSVNLVANLHNQQPLYYGSGAVDYQMQLKNSQGKVIKQQHLTAGSLTANAIAPLSLDMGRQMIKPGRYQYSMKVDTGDSKWHFKRYLVVSEHEANSLNKHNLFLKHDKLPFIIIIIILVILLFMIFLYVMFKYAFNRGIKRQR
ncbi:WxL protein host-binding domain-containing protein [Bombilactobacillus thymidiniphilus]|uniref:DUF916 and DUF3324 domain-containing protein n=1 Tax=Bombilactobacillus thymidiniphilus TaxID=2923363 RepID=A0ABY4PC02_9LACO|nr:DUF3324 domain-containing protein [Bombilactobacillus thymidiniphilus]UQS83216.1 DUF916 and DUF3324 domain-containing protein [Bombilactobacillus thymidiniphilus]